MTLTTIARAPNRNRWRAAVTAAATAAVLAAGAAGWLALHPRTITRTSIRTVTVTRWHTRTVTRWHTRTVTVTTPAPAPAPAPGNATYTGCIVNLWDSYVSVAQGGPAGDPSTFQLDCPGVHINGLVTP